jgi:hypothetical protein
MKSKKYKNGIRYNKTNRKKKYNKTNRKKKYNKTNRKKKYNKTNKRYKYYKGGFLTDEIDYKSPEMTMYSTNYLEKGYQNI